MGLEPITKEQCRSFVGDGARCLYGTCTSLRPETQSLKRIEEGMEVYSRIFGENCINTMYVLMDGVVQMLDSLKKKRE